MLKIVKVLDKCNFICNFAVAKMIQRYQSPTGSANVHKVKGTKALSEMQMKSVAKAKGCALWELAQRKIIPTDEAKSPSSSLTY